MAKRLSIEELKALPKGTEVVTQWNEVFVRTNLHGYEDQWSRKGYTGPVVGTAADRTSEELFQEHAVNVKGV